MNSIAILAAAITLQLSPGLSEPVGGDGALVEAAALVSTNAGATASLSVVYDVPTWGEVQRVETNATDVLTFVTNSVVVTNFSAFAASSNTPYVVSTVYGVSTTNYYTVATNSWTAMEPRPGPSVVTTNTVQEIVGYASVTNDATIASFEVGGGNGEVWPQNGTPYAIYPLAPGARLLFECPDPAATVTIFLR